MSRKQNKWAAYDIGAVISMECRKCGKGFGPKVRAHDDGAKYVQTMCDKCKHMRRKLLRANEEDEDRRRLSFAVEPVRELMRKVAALSRELAEVYEILKGNKRPGESIKCNACSGFGHIWMQNDSGEVKKVPCYVCSSNGMVRRGATA